MWMWESEYMYFCMSSSKNIPDHALGYGVTGCSRALQSKWTALLKLRDTLVANLFYDVILIRILLLVIFKYFVRFGYEYNFETV